MSILGWLFVRWSVKIWKFAVCKRYFPTRVLSSNGQNNISLGGANDFLTVLHFLILYISLKLIFCRGNWTTKFETKLQNAWIRGLWRLLFFREPCAILLLKEYGEPKRPNLGDWVIAYTRYLNFWHWVWTRVEISFILLIFKSRYSQTCTDIHSLLNRLLEVPNWSYF